MKLKIHITKVLFEMTDNLNNIISIKINENNNDNRKG